MDAGFRSLGWSVAKIVFLLKALSFMELPLFEILWPRQGLGKEKGVFGRTFLPCVVLRLGCGEVDYQLVHYWRAYA